MKRVYKFQLIRRPQARGLNVDRKWKYRGVSFVTGKQKWLAYCRPPGSRQYRFRGPFATDREAAEAYNSMVIEFKRDASELNALPDEPPPPEPREIQAACKAIRETWTDQDYAERAPHLVGAPAELLQLIAAEVLSAA